MGIIENQSLDSINCAISKPEAISYVLCLLLHMLVYFNMIASIVIAVINACRVILLSIHQLLFTPSSMIPAITSPFGNIKNVI